LGVREQINQKSGIALWAIGGVVLLLVCFVGWEFFGSRPSTHPPIGKCFYTSDDGRTWFADTADKIPPFDHDGAKAVVCLVFKCADSAPFAGYLRSSTQEFHDQKVGITRIDSAHLPLDPFANVLVKRPGDKNWVPSYTPEGTKIINDIPCPNGSADRPQPVLP
jgi:hypothetical protein